MEPTTLRLPKELLDRLDQEAEEAGFSSRSEYIRYLLLNSSVRGSGLSPTTRPNTSDTESGDQQETQLGQLIDRVSDLEDRISDNEQKIEEISSTLEGQISSPPANSDGLAHLRHWLDQEGPESEDAQAILLEAAQILQEDGPLSAKDLRERLFDRYPESYSSADTLWASTVERFHTDAPGFEKPEYGTYSFDPARD